MVVRSGEDFVTHGSRRPSKMGSLTESLVSTSGYCTVTALSVDEIGKSRWDGFVPRDLPHLRHGFLKAVEDSEQCSEPFYTLILRADTSEAVAAAVAYKLKVDLLTLVPRRYTRGINAVRRRLFPDLLYLSSMTCGPIVTNCQPNLFVAASLTPAEQSEAVGLVLDAIETHSKGIPLQLFFEFSEPLASTVAPAMAARGYLRAPSLPGTRLDVRWRSLDEYTSLLRKAFRRTIVKDRARAADLTFEIVDDFHAYAEAAWKLYKSVLDKAENVFEELTLPFFQALAAFEQSSMVLAREKATGKLVGMELLLRGETTLQDIYTGVDYAHNKEQHIYFNLLYPVLGYAGEKGFKQLSLGQTSYTFKARLGVTPFSTFLYIRHRNKLIHSILKIAKNALFPVMPTKTYRVFRDDTSSQEQEQGDAGASVSETENV